MYYHADKKCSQKVVALSSILTEQIIAFFNNSENIFCKNDIQNISIDIRLPLENQEKELPNSIKENFSNKYKKILKLLFNK